MENILTKNYTPYQHFRIEVVREKPFKEITTSSAQHVFEAMYDEASRQDRECFWVICLDNKNRVIGVNLVSIGSLTGSIVHPREVFKPAFLVSATSIILLHNHPSGDPTPSSEDREITSRLKYVGDVMGIQVLDHVIIGDGSYRSFKNEGWLNQPEWVEIPALKSGRIR